MSSEDFAGKLWQELGRLRSRANSLEQDISNLEATFSQLITSQANRLSELECFTHPSGKTGEAICNWLDFDEAE